MWWRKQNLIKGAVAKATMSLAKTFSPSSKYFLIANKNLWRGSGAQLKVGKSFRLKEHLKRYLHLHVFNCTSETRILPLSNNYVRVLRYH